MEFNMKDIVWTGGVTNKKEETVENTTSVSPYSAGKDEDNVVETKNNSVYFYSEVTRPKILLLNKNLHELGKNLVNQANLLGTTLPADIHLHINSFGGSVFAGLSATDYVKSSPVPIRTVVEGCAASAATLFSVVAHHRVIRKNSFMLIHQLSSGMWGKYEEMKDAMENNDLFMRIIKDIYEEHTKLPKRKINEILKRDLWFDAETCLEYGLVDEII